jgi:hypothetical protein
VKLSCQSCETELHPADVDFDVLRVRCRHCGWEFGSPVSVGPYRRSGRALVTGPRQESREMPDEQETANGEPAASADAPPASKPLVGRTREPIPLPEDVTLTEWEAGPLRIEIRRRSLGALLLGVGAAIAWGTYVGMMLADGHLPAWGAVLFLVSAAFAYVAGAMGLNRTSVLVAGGRLYIRHEPLPWPGRSVPAAGLAQLYVAVTGGPHEPGRYELRAITARGDYPLVTGLSQPQPALYLEQKLEERLSIPDRPVRGEYEPE